MALAQGQILQNRYRIVKLIGQGGFGAVYRAWDMTLKYSCAVKENFDASAEAQRQFEREATMMAALRHPALPRVSDHFALSGQGQYLVMDFIEGESLESLLNKRGKPFSESEIKGWMEQIGDALTYLHRLPDPIIHRDIKPENIIITSGNKAMLVDFGISKLYDQNKATTQGARAVTSGYSPLEQYGRGKTDARTDVYALGATIYHLLTNQLPPDSLDLVAGMDSLHPPRQLVPALSAKTEQAILQAMQLNACNRFSDMNTFLQALHATSAVSQSISAYAQPAPHQPVQPTVQLANMSAGSRRIAAKDGMVQLFVPAAKFEMGSNDGHSDEKPVHTVYLDAYWIDQTAVSNAQFDQFVRDTRYKTTAEKKGGGYTYSNGNWDYVKEADWRHPLGPASDLTGRHDHPVTLVSRHDAEAYCRWVDRRLPTEAEWEYAARGPNGNRYPWGKDMPDSRLANFDENEGGTTPVGAYQKGASWLGVLDMVGNVWEWTGDWYGDYPGSAQNNPTGASSGSWKVVRGGGWYNGREVLRGSERDYDLLDYAGSSLGFRCVQK